VIELALIVAGATLAAGVAVALLLRLLPTLRLQLAGFAFLAVVLPLAAVLLSGWVMFHMGDDVKILAVASAAASAAVVAGLLLGRSIVRRIDRLREATRSFALGDLTARTSLDGPEELAELASAFNEMARRLSELFDSRSELIAWASHDLRTPIASLKAMLEAVEDGVARPEELLPAVRTQVQTLERLVEDLFELASMEIGALTLDLRPVEVSDVVRSSVLAVEPEARNAGVQLQTATNGPARALCAPEKIERVLRNLLTNAVRHTPSGGSVVVSVAAENGAVQVTVEDDGEGLPPGAENRAFERFWRGDAARTGGRAGLGLTIARGLVEAHGGTIWAKSRPVGGTEVGFELPRS
jgi:two-component system sensor histidine kinase BaeS